MTRRCVPRIVLESESASTVQSANAMTVSVVQIVLLSPPCATKFDVTEMEGAECLDASAHQDSLENSARLTSVTAARMATAESWIWNAFAIPDGLGFCVMSGNVR